MRATNLANLMSAVLTLAVAAQAQTSRGTVTGTVLDPAGAVVVAARVKLTGVDTGVRLSTVSNDTGVYRFDAVDPGAYELKVAHPGFVAQVPARSLANPSLELHTIVVNSAGVRTEIDRRTLVHAAH